MSISTLDSKIALIAVDMQQGILPAAGNDREKIVANTSRVAQEFHHRNFPVVWVRALGMPEGRKIMNPPVGEPDPAFAEPDENLPIAATDLVVHKKALSGFTVPALKEHLQAQGITQVFVAGLAAGVGVESTARSAFDAGFNVVVLTDAIADPMPGRLENCLRFSYPAFAELGTSEELLNLLGKAA